LKIHSDSFSANIEINVDTSTRWSGSGTLDKKVSPGEYLTDVGNMIITQVREDLTFSFIGNGIYVCKESIINNRVNCWEFKKCGREPNGDNVNELGICPVCNNISVDGINNGKNGGRVCWAISGTLCGGSVQGSFAKKKLSCMGCDFFQKVKNEEKAEGQFGLMPHNQMYKKRKKDK